MSRTGIRERRRARPDERLSDYATRAGAKALASAGVDAADIDLVLVATMSQDEVTPNTAPLVAHALGAERAGAIDVGAACTAFLSGLSLATAQIEAGRADRVLLVGADFITRITNYEDRKQRAAVRRRGRRCRDRCRRARFRARRDRADRARRRRLARTDAVCAPVRPQGRDGRARGVPSRRQPDERGRRSRRSSGRG